MKRRAIWAALAGLILATSAIIWLGAGHVLHVVLRIGWVGMVYVVAWQLAVFALLGVAWWLVCPGAGVGVVVWGRLVREGGITSLPLSIVGGLTLGTRAVMLGGVGFARAAASSAVDVLTEGLALVPFVVFGLAMLLSRDSSSRLVLQTEIGAGALVLGGALGFLLRRPLARQMHRATELLLRSCVSDASRRAEELRRAFDELLRSRWRIAGATIVHLLGWCAGAGNVWIGYHLLGASPSILDALAIESIFSVALSVGFLVPGSLGVQEVAYVAIGRVFGMPADLSLALSLVRRARDLVIGAPALLAWQIIEARRLRRGERAG